MSSVSIDDAALPVAEPAVPEQWETIEQEQEAASFGMWLFLATEMLFFGGLFLCYAVYRFTHTDGFLAGARESDLKLGTVNTIILLTSSLTMVMAVQGGRAGLRGLVWKCLAATALLGGHFLPSKVTSGAKIWAATSSRTCILRLLNAARQCSGRCTG